MKKFLIYVGIFSLSLILLAGGMEYMLRQVPNSFVFKRNLLEEHGKEIKTLIIGSSVVNCGINPAYFSDSTYNVAISGEWLKFNQLLFEKYVDRLPHIRNLVWGICFHALWCDDDGKDERNIVNHDIYLDIRENWNPLHKIELLSLGALAMRKWSKYYLLHGTTMYCDSLGVDHSYDFANKEADWLEEIPRMVRSQHKPMLEDKDSTMYRANIHRMHEVAELCHDRGIHLYLVMPPVHPEYYRLADKEQLELIRKAVAEVATRWDNVSCHEYFGDTRFTDDDFYDGNHLSSDIGAEKFTKILKEDLFE